MSYPQAGWQPPPPPHAYGPPGARPWVPPYGVPPPQPYAAYAHPAKPPVPPPKDDYWSTALTENPLGLENMHIRVDSGQSGGNGSSTSASTARVPSSSTYSRASDYATRNSYPPNSSTKASSLTPSKSQPNTRGPSPARPRHYEQRSERDKDRDVTARRARYAYPDNHTTTTTLNSNGSASHGPSAYQRPPSRSHSGRTSVPVESGGRYSSASASAAAHAAQMASRSQTLPGASHHRHANVTAPGVGVSHAQAIQRSKTLPSEVLTSSPRRGRTTTAPVPRRASDRYDYRYPEDEYEDTELEDEEEERIARSWAQVNVDKATGRRDREKRKEDINVDRNAGWIDGAERTGSPHHDPGYDPSQMQERQTRSREKLRSNSYQQAPVKDGHDYHRDKGTYDVPGMSAATYAHERRRERDGVERRSSAPNPAHGSTSAYEQDQERSVSYAGLGTRVTEEPQDTHGRYPTQRSPSYYTRSRQSPYKGQERKWSYRQEDLSGSSSSPGSDDESEDDYDRRQLGRRQGTRDGQRKFAETSPTRRFSGNIGQANQGNVYLPSPRSLRQSDRTPSARPSYEQVSTAREHERSRTPNGHLPVSVSSASAAAAARGYTYSTPPVTPNRQDQTQRTNTARMAYVPEPTPSVPTAAVAVASVDSAYAQAKPTYMYGGSNASPSPRRTVSAYPQTQSFAQPSQHAQSQAYTHAPVGQYAGTGIAETKHKRRSPHASRSPSPLPPGQKTSSSSAYYATLGQSSAATPSRAHSRSYGHPQPYEHSHGRTQTPSQATAQVHDGRRRSSSRTGVTGSGYSSASGAAAAASSTSTSAAQGAGGGTRHVRAGFWNRRGDHLTETGYVVYCPPGRCYPRDLADYPDTAFKDHLGNVVNKTADVYPELPESVPRSAGRAPEKSYDSFITFVLVTDKR